MSDFFRKNGATSNLFRFKLRSATTGQGFTGVTNATSGLNVSVICDVEATSTTYTGASIQTIATLGTFAAPSANSCRLAQVDATNQPGLYELQILDARFSVANAKQISITVSGVTGCLDKTLKIQLTAADIDDATKMGIGNLDTNVGSRPTAAQIAAAILKTPANLIATNSDNSVNVDGIVTPPTTAAIATAVAASILKTPANLIATNSDNSVNVDGIVTPPTTAAIATAVAASILKTPANLIATNSDNSVNVDGSSGNVTVESFTSDAIAQLGSAKITVVNSLTVTGTTRQIELVSGDGYSAALGNAISVTLSGTFPDVSTWTCSLLVERDVVTIAGNAVIVSATTSTIVLSVSFLSTDTIKLVPGNGIAQIRFYAAGVPVTPVRKIPAVIDAGLVVGP